MIPATRGDGDRLRCEKPRTSWQKTFFADEKADFTAIPKECALLLTKQYYTITPFPDQDKKDDSCLTVRSVCCLPRNKSKPAGLDLSDLRHPRTWFLMVTFFPLREISCWIKNQNGVPASKNMGCRQRKTQSVLFHRIILYP